MTINSTNRIAGPFAGTGIQTAYPFTFKAFIASDIRVVQTAVISGITTTLVLNTDYTVVLNANQNVSPGGIVTMLSPPSSGITVAITTRVPNTQPSDLTNAGDFYPQTVNDSFDRATIQIQQIQGGGLLSLPITANGTSTELPFPKANNVIAWNDTGTALINVSDTLFDPVYTGMVMVPAYATLGALPGTYGQVVYLTEYTAGVPGGGGYFKLQLGSVTNNYGTRINSASSGYYWQRINYTRLSVAMFGASGNTVQGSTIDESLQFQRAVNAAQIDDTTNELELAPVYYKWSSTVNILVRPIKLVGKRPSGIAYPGTDSGGTVGVLGVIGSHVDWAGATSEPMLFIQKQNAGGELSNITFNGNNLCSYCVHADTVVYWNFKNIWCRNPRVFGFYLDSRFGSCSWNNFNQLRCSAGYGFDSTAGLALGGYSGAYNTCHNTFTQTTIEHGRTSYGLLLGFCDNNSFTDTYINTDNSLISPTAYGVTYTVSGAVWAYGNTFNHLQAGNKGYYEPPGSYGGNQAIATINGYATDNAQPLPIRALITTSGNTYTGTHISFLSGDIWGVRTLGINTPDTVRSYPVEILSPNPNSNGTQVKLGQAHYIGSNLMETFDLTGCAINAAGTVISTNGSGGTGSASGIRYSGSSIAGFCFSGINAGDPLTLSAGAQPFGFTFSGGNWTFAFNGATPSLRITGVGTPTGASLVSSFPGATATLVQTSGAMAWLLAELKNKGLIGA